MQYVDIHNKNKGLFMKWNTEWVDLQNIEHMVAECWRMGEYQLEKYVQKLSKQQDLIFAGELGLGFLEMLRKSVEEEKPVDWAKLQRDIHLMQELIRDGQAQYDLYWKSQYQELTAAPNAYFGTEFGRAFTEQIAAKLELNISEEQRMLQHDISKIQKICSSFNWDDEEKAKKALFLLTRDEKYYFSSWLGDAFINVLQQRYGKKEEEEESEFQIQPEAAAVNKFSFKVKIAWMLFIGIAAGIIAFLLYMQADGGRGREKLQQLLSQILSSEYKENTDVAQNADGIEDKYTLDTGGEIAADWNGQSVKTAPGADHRNTDVKAADGRNVPAAEEQTAAAAEEQAASDAGEDTVDSYGTGETNSIGQSANQNPAKSTNTHIPDKNTANTGSANGKHTEALKILPQYESFHEQYPDLFGWLKIPGTRIDHPVMQSDDEKRGERYYYLHRDYTGKQMEAGSLFVETASSCFPQDKNTVIYGHNMSNGQGFGILENYKEPDFFKNHPLIQYDTIYETGTWQIAAVIITRILYQDEEGFRYYRFYNYDSEQEFEECMRFVKENQLYDTGSQLQYGDQILMLSTCEYSKPNGRLVVVAKKVE